MLKLAYSYEDYNKPRKSHLQKSNESLNISLDEEKQSEPLLKLTHRLSSIF
jgi:hypothetical protein